MLILVAGDAHIPDLASGIPGKIQDLLQPGKIDQVVSVGNISDTTTLEYLNKLSPGTPIVSVLGDCDVPAATSQTLSTLTAGKFKIGVVSSFLITPVDDIDVLAATARKLDVDILLWGGKYQQETQEWAGRYFVNPGSLTGASPNIEDTQETQVPSFCLLNVKDDACTLFMYQLHGETLKVEKAQLPYVTQRS